MSLHLALPRLIHSRPHLSLAIVLGAATWPLLPHDWQALTRLLLAWDVTVWTYLVTMVYTMLRADHHDIRRAATRQDEKGPVILATLSVAVFISLAAIVSQLSSLKPDANDSALQYSFVALTLVGSWLMVGVMFCSHYAHLYYTNEHSEAVLGFPDQQLTPHYWDFLYFSFTISVAVQTSDVSVGRPRRRQGGLGQKMRCLL
ncbi:MAG: DUF1345 domain-containing protein [Duganella sp.]